MIAATLVVRRIRRAFRLVASVAFLGAVALPTMGCVSDFLYGRTALHENLILEGYFVGESGLPVFVTRAEYFRPALLGSKSNLDGFGDEPTCIVLDRATFEKLRSGKCVSTAPTSEIEGTVLLQFGEKPWIFRPGARGEESRGLRIEPDEYPSRGMNLYAVTPPIRMPVLWELDVPFEYTNVDGQVAMIDMRTLFVRSNRWRRELSDSVVTPLLPITLILDVGLLGVGFAAMLPVMAVSVVALPILVPWVVYADRHRKPIDPPIHLPPYFIGPPPPSTPAPPAR